MIFYFFIIMMIDRLIISIIIYYKVQDHQKSKHTNTKKAEIIVFSGEKSIFLNHRHFLAERQIRFYRTS